MSTKKHKQEEPDSSLNKGHNQPKTINNVENTPESSVQEGKSEEVCIGTTTTSISLGKISSRNKEGEKDKNKV